MFIFDFYRQGRSVDISLHYKELKLRDSHDANLHIIYHKYY